MCVSAMAADPGVYSLRCNARGVVVNGQAVDLDLNGVLEVVSDKKMVLRSVNSSFFAYFEDFADSVKGAKRPADVIQDFDFTQAKDVKNNPKYRPIKYKNHVQFKMPFTSSKVEFVLPIDFTVTPENKPAEKFESNIQIVGPSDHWGGSVTLRCTAHETSLEDEE